MEKNPIWLGSRRKLVDKILALEPKYKEMTDRQLKHKTVEFRNRISRGENLNRILPEAYAAVREASDRTLGMKPYPVQLLCAIALHEGKMAEQKTGEGKTLVATLPTFLNALTGKGVHVVSVNDYLTQRDANWMGELYSFMGLSVGVVTSGMSTEQRKSAYGCDLTYVTNSELGFDYLRDHMALSIDRVVQRGFYYAIIDEADSILIDAARTPIIISGAGIDLGPLYTATNSVAKRMICGSESKEFNRMDALVGDLPEETGDFIVHEKDHNITLTAHGVEKICESFGICITNYSGEEHYLLRHAVRQSLYANHLMKRDRDYIVKGGKVQIVDQFTGRILEGHRYSEGLQQAVEAKERVQITRNNITAATITYQSLFSKYQKICGMTGTAYTDRKEIRETYGIKTVIIPTNKTVVRNDEPIVMYSTRRAKYQKVFDEVKHSLEKQQPVLIGTSSIRESEELDYLLSIEDIPHRVLNAKQDAKEAEIVAKAGIHGSVTVATNMAGRGTDIKLDEIAREAGGLKVIGTQIHESVRIDNQLRGRSGRQGDPGESCFFVSAEDQLIRLYAGDRLKKLVKMDTDSEPIPKRLGAYYAEHAQHVVEENLAGERKSMLGFEKVNDRQRELVYSQREGILKGKGIDEKMRECIHYYLHGLEKDSRSVGEMAERFQEDTRIDQRMEEKVETGHARKEKRMFRTKLESLLIERYEDRKSNQLEREKGILLKALDGAWMEQIRALDYLRQSVGYHAYAQMDPATVYTLDAFRLFRKMQRLIYRFVIIQFFNEGVQ